jgi:hypothetical protein
MRGWESGEIELHHFGLACYGMAQCGYGEQNNIILGQGSVFGIHPLCDLNVVCDSKFDSSLISRIS